MLPVLPIDPLIPEILALLLEKDQVILTATPGAGKTTRLPPELLKTVKGKIAVLEPRRMATVAAAGRVAEEQNWKLGEKVGYQVRFDSRIGKNTRLVFMTDALLLRRLVDDPELKEFDLVVIDEFHERNLNQDLLLGVLKELQELGSGIKLLIMSATLDVNRLQAYLPESAHIDVPGKVFPLEIRNSTQPLKMSTDRDFIDRVADMTASLARERSGDILVFLPGVGEIHRVQEALEQKNLPRDIFPLHGSLSLNEQGNILKIHDRPRVILATNIAEASVTVPGVDTVLDTGLAKIMEVNLQSGFSRLDLSRIAHFNARQRAGRAARQKPGLCVRLWTTHEEITMDEEMAPECQRVDLSQPLLLLSHLGINDFSNFSWFDAPPSALLKMALNSLKTIHAIDEEGRLTVEGKKLMNYPLPPRWGALLNLTETLGHRKLAAQTAALLQDKDIVHGRSESSSHQECDVTYRLGLLEDVEKGRHVGGVNMRQAQTVLESAEQLERLIPRTTVSPTTKSSDNEPLRRLLLSSQSDHLCRRRKGSDRAVMVGGRGVRLAKESQVRESEFFIAVNGVDFPGQPDTTVSIACGLSKQFVLEILKNEISLSEDVYFDETKGQFFARRIRRFKDLDLDEPALTPIRPEDLGERFVEALVSRWPWLVEQNEDLKHWMARWKYFCALDPAFEGQLSKDHISQALNFAAFGKTRVSDVVSEDLVRWLESTMDKNIIKQFHKEVPAKFTAPSGFSHAIHYTDAEGPFVEVRLQEIFGLTTTPRIGFGKTALTFKLLAPNYRPTQVTSDIASFWKNTYFEVRKELRMRYPKHSWPDDPLTAIPVAKGQRRRN
jgi:ATP-dependent helicase HrpB